MIEESKKCWKNDEWQGGVIYGNWSVNCMTRRENIFSLFLSHGLGRASRSFFQYIFLSIYPHQTKKHRGQHKIFFSLSSPPLLQNSLLNLPFSPPLSLYRSVPVPHSIPMPFTFFSLFQPHFILWSRRVPFLTALPSSFSSVRWIGKEDPTADLATTPFSGFVGTPPSLISALPTANSLW